MGVISRRKYLFPLAKEQRRMEEQEQPLAILKETVEQIKKWKRRLLNLKKAKGTDNYSERRYKNVCKIVADLREDANAQREELAFDQEATNTTEFDDDDVVEDREVMEEIEKDIKAMAELCKAMQKLKL